MTICCRDGRLAERLEQAAQVVKQAYSECPAYDVVSGQDNNITQRQQTPTDWLYTMHTRWFYQCASGSLQLGVVVRTVTQHQSKPQEFIDQCSDRP